jgi:hypothetical protein
VGKGFEAAGVVGWGEGGGPEGVACLVDWLVWLEFVIVASKGAMVARLDRYKVGLIKWVERQGMDRRTREQASSDCKSRNVRM